MELLIGAAGALLFLTILVKLAPRLGGSEDRAKGLSALQAMFALLGIVFVAEWYLVEQPDAARLKFDQTATGIPLSTDRALIAIEVTISNVGGHTAHFEKLPYKIFVQQVAPLSGALPPSPASIAPGLAPVWRSDNWGALAYRAVGAASSSAYPNWDRCLPPEKGGACDDGLETVIGPGETENLYFAAVVPCRKGLVAAVSSRFAQPPGPWQWIGNQQGWWIKQSYVDLSGPCTLNQARRGVR